MIQRRYLEKLGYRLAHVGKGPALSHIHGIDPGPVCHHGHHFS